MTRLQLQRRRRGNAIIELALSASILIPTFAGVFQYGYSFYVYNTLQGSVRSAARFASVVPYTSTNANPTATYLAEVKNMVIYGKPNPVLAGPGVAVADLPIVPGLSSANVDVSVEMAGGIPKTVTVQVINFDVNAVFQTFRFHQKPAATFWYNGPTS